jgi:hypothetical protein
MNNPMIRIHNVETNEVIDREMTADELKKYQKEQADFIAKQDKEASQAAAKTALLAKLGITAEEAALLLG